MHIHSPPSLIGPFGHAFDCIQVACARGEISSKLVFRSLKRNFVKLYIGAKAHSFVKLKLQSSQTLLVRNVVASNARPRCPLAWRVAELRIHYCNRKPQQK